MKQVLGRDLEVGKMYADINAPKGHDRRHELLFLGRDFGHPVFEEIGSNYYDKEKDGSCIFYDCNGEDFYLIEENE